MPQLSNDHADVVVLDFCIAEKTGKGSQFPRRHSSLAIAQDLLMVHILGQLLSQLLGSNLPAPQDLLLARSSQRKTRQMMILNNDLPAVRLKQNQNRRQVSGGNWMLLVQSCTHQV